LKGVRGPPSLWQDTGRAYDFLRRRHLTEDHSAGTSFWDQIRKRQDG